MQPIRAFILVSGSLLQRCCIRQQRNQRLTRGWNPAASQSLERRADGLEVARAGEPGKLLRLALKSPPLHRRRVVMKRAQRRFGTAVFSQKVLVEVTAQYPLQCWKPSCCASR